MSLILFGPPGCGKGTQAKRLAEKLQWSHLSTGDLFRKNIRNKTELGSKVESILSSGGLVPDELTNAIVERELFEEKEGYILDGYPRTLSQANHLWDLIADSGGAKPLFVEIMVSKDVLVRRLTGRRTCSKCGTLYNVFDLPPKFEGVCDLCSGQLGQRADDVADVVLNRLNAYDKSTRPVKEFFVSRLKVVDVNGEMSPEKVFENLINLLQKS